MAIPLRNIALLCAVAHCFAAAQQSSVEMGMSITYNSFCGAIQHSGRGQKCVTPAFTARGGGNWPFGECQMQAGAFFGFTFAPNNIHTEVWNAGTTKLQWGLAMGAANTWKCLCPTFAQRGTNFGLTCALGANHQIQATGMVSPNFPNNVQITPGQLVTSGCSVATATLSTLQSPWGPISFRHGSITVTGYCCAQALPVFDPQLAINWSPPGQSCWGNIVEPWATNHSEH